jgi:hypothetical protein
VAADPAHTRADRRPPPGGYNPPNRPRAARQHPRAPMGGDTSRRLPAAALSALPPGRSTLVVEASALRETEQSPGLHLGACDEPDSPLPRSCVRCSSSSRTTPARGSSRTSICSAPPCWWPRSSSRPTGAEPSCRPAAGIASTPARRSRAPSGSASRSTTSRRRSSCATAPGCGSPTPPSTRASWTGRARRSSFQARRRPPPLWAGPRPRALRTDFARSGRAEAAAYPDARAGHARFPAHALGKSRNEPKPDLKEPEDALG